MTASGSPGLKHGTSCATPCALTRTECSGNGSVPANISVTASEPETLGPEYRFKMSHDGLCVSASHSGNVNPIAFIESASPPGFEKSSMQAATKFWQENLQTGFGKVILPSTLSSQSGKLIPHNSCPAAILHLLLTKPNKLAPTSIIRSLSYLPMSVYCAPKKTSFVSEM